jgi:ribosomal protein S18 acetylase RimI-like enzyme
MKTNEHVLVCRAETADADSVASLAGELLQEIMDRIGSSVFHFDLEETKTQLAQFIDEEKNFVFAAQAGKLGETVGFVTVYESFALYAEGAFGTMAELYVRPAYRSQGAGKALIDAVKAFGHARGWKRLEVTTPPLPQFDATLAFYEREGFAVSGGRKLKTEL